MEQWRKDARNEIIMVDIDRINFLAKKQREEGLTEEEKAEQAKLRRAYIDSVVGNLKSQLDNTYVVEGDEKKKLEKVKNRDGEPLAKSDNLN